MNIAIQRPMKSPGDSGSILSMKARMPPHWAWPSTTMCLMRSTLTAYSSAAETPWAPPSGWIHRHQIGDVAHHEQFAGAGVEDHLRRDAGIAAADHHHRRRLAALGQFPVARLFGRQPLRGEGPVAVEQMLRKCGAMAIA